MDALVGGRYSYTQAILAAVAPDYSLGYGDYQARLSYAASGADRLTLFAFGGYDFLRNEVEHRTSSTSSSTGWTSGGTGCSKADGSASASRSRTIACSRSRTTWPHARPCKRVADCALARNSSKT